MDTKICLITGGNSGIGKVTAQTLVMEGFQVVMLCRNETKARAAMEEIKQNTGRENIDLIIADLSSQQQVKKAAEEFNAKYDRLDMLINNAGLILGKERKESEDHIELSLATNHLGHFLLTYLLWEALQKSKASPVRIINVSSEAHRFADIDPENLQLTSGYSGLKAYGNSKLCNILFTKELDRRVQNSNMVVNAMHPGGVASNFGQEISGWFKIAWFLYRPFMISPEKGAETLNYLALSEEGGKVSGKYFKDKKPVSPTRIATNEQLAEQIWEKSEQLTGIKFLEPVKNTI